MQQVQRFHRLHRAHAILAAAWAGSIALGCSSDHFLGDLSPPDLSGDGEGNGTGGGQDFLVSPVLGPPEMEMVDKTYILRSHVVGIGDLDGDGFGDIATRNWDQTIGFKYIHVRYGGPRPEDDISVFAWSEGGARLTLDTPDNCPFIDTITSLGDVDADGYSDVLVDLSPSNGEREGAYLLYGGPERLDGVARLSDAGVYLQSPRAFDATRNGCSASSTSDAFPTALGDFDGDGFDDFLLTDPPSTNIDDYPETGTKNTGGAYLFYGRSERLESGTSWLSADARLLAPHLLKIFPTGDVNADGLGDVILGTAGLADRGGYYWLPGRQGKLSGEIDVATLGTAMADSESFVPAMAAGDLDGDGIDDVLSYDEAGKPHLFYGEAGLFDAGVDLSHAAAILEIEAGQPHLEHLIRANDLDGDGDDELVSYRRSNGTLPPRVAVLTGTSSRMNGHIGMPEGSSTVQRPEFLVNVFPVGDLDGDGAGDVVTRSGHFDDYTGQFEGRDDIRQLNFHFGTPGGLAAPPR